MSCVWCVVLLGSPDAFVRIGFSEERAYKPLYMHIIAPYMNIYRLSCLLMAFFFSLRSTLKSMNPIQRMNTIHRAQILKLVNSMLHSVKRTHSHISTQRMCQAIMQYYNIGIHMYSVHHGEARSLNRGARTRQGRSPTTHFSVRDMNLNVRLRQPCHTAAT